MTSSPMQWIIGVGNGEAPPEHLTTDPLILRTGERYLAAIAISGFLVSSLASVSTVRKEAQKRGFRDVVVTEDKPPPNSPSTVEADYFVIGTFDRPDQEISRVHGGGSVRIVDAWRLSTRLPPPPPPPPPENRSSGLNSAWALIELLRVESAGGAPETVRAMTDEYNRALRVEDPNSLPGSFTDSDALIEVLNAQNRGAPDDVVQVYINAYDRARASMPSPETPTSLNMRILLERRRRERLQKALREGAKLGHLRFGSSPGVSFGTLKASESAHIGLDLGIEDKLVGATLRRIGAVVLVTSPFWLLLLLSPGRASSR